MSSVVPPPTAPMPMSRTTLAGVRAVARHEFRVRLRTGRWRVLLALWFLLVGGLTALLAWAMYSVEELDRRGVPVFGGLMMILMSLSMLVVPALAGQSVNGDRERGVLATLQVTLLTPTEIALGKLAAAWGVALVFLFVATPMAISTLFMGGVGVGRLLVTLLVVAVLLGVVAAIAQCWSALLSRTGISAVLSYLSVFGLTVGTLMAFGLALPATSSLHEVTREVTDYESLVDGVVEGERPSLENLPTKTVTEMREDVRPEKVWWLLAPNPFVILADAAPQKQRAFEVTLDGNGAGDRASVDPLGAIAGAVRDARDPNSSLDDGLLDGRRAEQSPVWPWGLAFDALLGVGAVAITVRRLRTPSKKLAKGVRVA
ncbi:MAG: ABC transporter permease [Sporichthyaceae bacterium]